MTSEDTAAHSQRKASWTEWEREFAGKITDSINFVRTARGYTIRQLGELLTQVGWPATTSTLNGMLSSKKRTSYSVGDVFAFALALDVPPAVLIFGLPDPGKALPGPLFDPSTPLEKLPFWLDSPNLSTEVPGDASLTSLPRDLAKYYEAYEDVHFHNRMMIAANDERFDPQLVEQRLPNHKNGTLLRQAIAKLATAKRHLEFGAEFGAPRPAVRSLPPELELATETILEDEGPNLPIRSLNSPADINDARSRVARITAGSMGFSDGSPA